MLVSSQPGIPRGKCVAGRKVLEEFCFGICSFFFSQENEICEWFLILLNLFCLFTDKI